MDFDITALNIALDWRHGPYNDNAWCKWNKSNGEEAEGLQLDGQGR